MFTVLKFFIQPLRFSVIKKVKNSSNCLELNKNNCVGEVCFKESIRSTLPHQSLILKKSKETEIMKYCCLIHLSIDTCNPSHIFFLLKPHKINIPPLKFIYLRRIRDFFSVRVKYTQVNFSWRCSCKMCSFKSKLHLNKHVQPVNILRLMLSSTWCPHQYPVCFHLQKNINFWFFQIISI